MAQQPRRTHVFINPAVSVAIQSPGASPLIQEPRRTKLFNPNTIPRFETPSLSRRLREETMTELDRAKNAKFVRDLLEGELSRERYCQFLACIHEIYTVLEWLLERHRDHPVAGRFYMPHLFRAQAVQQDLDYFLRGRPLEPVRDLAPVRGWIQRLTYISDNHPELLAAHAYVRYMRELCGCEEAAERVARTFRLSLDAPEGGAPRGLAYHYFKGLRDLDAARADFRARLDGIPTELVEEDDFLREARRAFTLNYAMVLELV
jgi:heme oxygenase